MPMQDAQATPGKVRIVASPGEERSRVMRQPRKVSVHSDEKAWDVIWKWIWFTKETWRHDFRKVRDGTRRALKSLLAKLGVRTVLDCSCGLGWKTIMLAEMGYEVEGSDGCALAVRCARKLTREEGLKIRFFHSRWQDLGRKCRRRYDCVYNDALAWIRTRRSLEACARGICSVLEPGGRLIFQGQGAYQWSHRPNKKRYIDEQLKKEGQFELHPPYESGGVKVTVLITREKTPDGILGNRIHIIDDHGKVRVEIASVLDLCKWTWQDYQSVLRKAGFRKLYSVKEKGIGPEPYILNVAVK